MRSTDHSGHGPISLADAAFAAIVEHVAVIDRKGVILAVNHAWTAFAQALGVRDPAVVGPGVNYLDICARAAHADLPAAAAALDGIDAVCAGRQSSFELEYRADAAGEAQWYLMTVTPLDGPSGGAVVSHRNVTERKQRELAMRERTASMLMDALPVAIKILDVNAGAEYLNAAWLRVTNRSFEEQLGLRWLESLHADDQARCRAECDGAIATRGTMVIEYRIRRPDGSDRWLLDRAVPHYDADGRFSGIVCASLDVTERRTTEAKMRSLTARLVSAQEDERRRIARELHDDINQRLALLAIGIEQLTLPVAPDDPLRAKLSELSQATSEISTEVHNLSHELHSSTLDALGLVPALRSLSLELSRKGLCAAFSSDVAGSSDISPDRALALFRVAQEALANVLKHSGVHEATLRVSFSDDVVTLQVEDRGCGFDMQAHGEGLGLLSMRERLLPLGGSVAIRSHPGRGTVVEARVPRQAAGPVAVDASVHVHLLPAHAGSA